MLNKLLSIFLPETCRVCHKILKDSKKICLDCEEKIPWVEKPFCTQCGMPYESSTSLDHPCYQCTTKPPLFEWHRSCATYKEPINNLVYQFKYNSRLDLAPLFTSWIRQKHSNFLNKIDYLIPIPLSTKRLKKRTYNQSVELAKELSSQAGIPVLINSLKKNKETLPQTELPRNKRIENLRGAFSWNDSQDKLKNKKVILIDDVYTTGSTLVSCAKVLHKYKPSTIGALTVAINPLK